jgi:hypothetical protein
MLKSLKAIIAFRVLMGFSVFLQILVFSTLSTIMEFRENFEREIPETSPAEFFVAIIG